VHLEIRGEKGAKKYYLAYSYRKAGKVRKLRVYLGANLGGTELAKRRKVAEAELLQRASASRMFGDPFETVLTKTEIGELKALEAKANVRVIHLLEDDWKKFTKAFTYDTNAIEGSSVESKEVGEILEKGKWPDKPKADISETYGVAKAIGFVRKTKEHLSLDLILDLHRIVFENSKHYAGRFRERGIEVVVTDGRGNVELVRWYEKNKRKYPPLVLAAVVHNQFENIHPFQDGNGRVGRLLLNNILLKYGLPPINIELKNRGEYYAALQAYENQHNLRPTVELMLKEYRSLKKLLRKR